MINNIIKGLLSMLIFANVFLNIFQEIHPTQIQSELATVFPTAFAQSSETSTGTCILNGKLGESIQCCNTSADCPSAPGQTRTCEPGYACEYAISTEPYIIIDKNVDKTTAIIGETVVYTINVINIGSGDALGLVFSDSFPAGFDPLFWNTGTIVPGNPDSLEHDFDLSGHSTFTFIITGVFSSAGVRNNISRLAGPSSLTGQNCSLVFGKPICTSNRVSTTILPPITGQCGIPAQSLLYNFTGNGRSLTGGSNGLCSTGTAISFSYNGSTHERSRLCSGANGAPNSPTCNASEAYCGDGTTGNSIPAEQCDYNSSAHGLGCTNSCTRKTLNCDDIAFNISPQIFVNETGFANRDTGNRYTMTSILRGDLSSPTIGLLLPIIGHQYTSVGSFTGMATITHVFTNQTIECSDTIKVINTGNLQILKTIDDSNVEEGEIVTYTITINNGTLTTQAGQIEDILPSAFRIISPSVTPFPMAFSLSPGSGMSYLFSGYFNTTGVWINTGTIIGNIDGCSMPGSICTSSVSTNVYSSGLVINKSGFIYSGGVESKSGRVGQLVNFVITLINTSIHTIKEIFIQDIMTPGFYGDVIETIGTTWDAMIQNRYVPSLSSNQTVTLTFSGYFTGAGFKTNTGIIVDGYKEYNGGFGTSANYITVGTASDTIWQTGCAVTYNPTNIKTFRTGVAQISPTSYMVYVMNVGANPGMVTSFATSSIAGRVVGIDYDAFIGTGTNGLFKISNRDYASLGDEVNYGIIYINNTTVASNNFTGMDTLVPGYRPLSIQGIYDPIGGVWTIGTVVPQGYSSLFFKGYYELPGPKTNTVTSSGYSASAINHIVGSCIPTDGTNVIGGGGGDNSGEPTLPELWIWKSTDILNFTNIPQAINYYLLIGNSGASIIDGSITVIDYLPASFTGLSSVYYTDNLGNTGNINYQYLTSTNQIILSGLSLAYNQTGLITIVGLLSGSYASGQKIVNSGTIYYYSGGVVTGSELIPPLYTNNISYATSTYLDGLIATGWATGLSVHKTITPITGSVGQIFTYTITLTNTGIYTINNVIISDPLSQLILNGFTGIVASPSTGSFNSTNGLRSVPQIQPNQTFTLTLSGYFISSGVKPNTAVLGGCQGSFGCNGTATGYVFDTGAKITKIANVTTGCIGSIITYTITVSNNGIQNINNLNIIDTLPSGFVVTSSGSTGSNSVNTNGSTNRIIPNFGTTNQVFIITGFFNTTGIKVNTGLISGCNNVISADCISTVTVTITDDKSICSSGVTISKEISQAVASVGQIIAYIITVQNLNQYTVNDLYVQEILPSGFTGMVVGTSTGTYDTATNIWYIPGIASGSSASLLLSGYFTSTGTKVNVAVLSGCNGTGCTGIVTGVITDQIVTGECGMFSGFIVPYGTAINGLPNSYCSGGSISGLQSFTGYTSWYCSGLNGGASIGPCIMTTPNCGDGIVQTGNEACDTGLPLTTGQISCDNSCKTLYACAGTGMGGGGFIYIDPNTPSTIIGGCCTGLTAVQTLDPLAIADGGYSCLVPARDLALTKTLTSAQTGFASGDIVNYTITVYNQGNTPASDIQIIDYLPNGLDYIPQAINRTLPNYTSGWQTSGANIILSGRYRLNPGESLQIPLSLRVNANATGNISNSAELLYSSGDIDSTSDNNPVNDCYSGNNNISGNALSGGVCSPVTDEDDYDSEDITIVTNSNITPWDLSIDKEVISTGAYTIGSVVTYRLSFITNKIATNVSIQDTLPAGMSFSGTTYSNNTGFVYSGSNGQTHSRSIELLMPGTTGIIEYQAVVNSISTGMLNVVSILPDPTSDPETIPYASGICTTGMNPLLGNYAVSGTNNVDCEEIITVPLCSTGEVFNSNTNQCVPYLLSIAKQGPSQASYIINQDILYLIQVTNHGPQAATGVVIQDYLPNGFALNYTVMNSLYGGNPIQPSVNGSTITWNIPSIASGQIITLFVYGKFTESHGVGTGTNTGAITSGYCINCTGVDTKHVDICGPEGYLLSINKTGNRTTSLVYDMWNYTISVNSIGYATATNLLVKELFPSDFVITNYSVSNGTFATGGGSGLWTIASLSPNSSRFLNVTGYYVTSGIKINTATLTNTCSTCNPNPNASWTGVVGAYPYLLSIDKSSTTGSLIAIGQPIMYALDVHNYGPQNATGVVITDVLPVGFVLIENAVIDAQNVINGASYGYTGYSYNASTRTITWNIANIPSGNTPRLLIYGYPTVQGILLNTATISSGLCLGTGCYDSDIKNVDICGPEGYLLSINKTSSRGDNASGTVQSPISYTITVTNTGYKAANNVSISDIVPAGFSGTTTTSTGSFTLAGGIWNLSLGIGQSATLTLNGYYLSSGVKTNTATITSGVCLPGSCSSTVTNIITDVPYNLIINKSIINSNVLATTGTALINDNLTYTITITNQGPQIATGIAVSDLMPSGFVLNSFIPYQVSTGTFNTSAMTWNQINLGVGQSATLQLLGQYITDGIKTNYAVIMSGLAFNKTGVASINVLPCTNGMTCIHTGVCNTGYHAQVYTGTPTIDTGLLCIGGTTTGLIKTDTGWTWNCLGMGGGGNTNGCYLTIDTGNSNTNQMVTGVCSYTGSVLVNQYPSTGNLCSEGILGSLVIALPHCAQGTPIGQCDFQYRSWSCNGSYSGANASCNATFTITGNGNLTTGFDLSISKTVLSGATLSGQIITYQLEIYNSGAARSDIGFRDEFMSSNLIYITGSFSGIYFNNSTLYVTPYNNGYPGLLLGQDFSMSSNSTGTVRVQFMISGNQQTTIVNTGVVYGRYYGSGNPYGYYSIYGGEYTGNNYSSVSSIINPSNGNTGNTCGTTGQVICTTGNACMTGLVNSGGVCMMAGSTGTNNTGASYLSGLRINKTVSRLYALPGETVTWTISYGVYGTGIYEGIKVDDVLPVGGEFVSTSLSTGYSYTGGVLSYNVGTLTGVYTGSFTLLMKIGTGVTAGTQLVNTVSGSASGWNTVIGTAMVNVGLVPIVYIPVNLGGGSRYEPVPLPEAPMSSNTTTTIPEVITYIVKKTRILAVQAEENLPLYLVQASEQLSEYIPYYTQPLEAIKKNVEVMPHTGVITLYEIIMRIIKEIL